MTRLRKLNQDFRDLLLAFSAEGVEFMIVGAYALALHGVPRFTGDLDVFVRPTRANAARVWRALVRFGAPIEAAGVTEEDFATPGVVYQIGLPPRRIDLLTEISGVGFDEAWAEFLDVAALSDGAIVNFSTIARECGVSSHTTKSHFQILEDTLLGRWLPAYRKRAKRRVIGSPKFYFVDVGIVNRLARRGELVPGAELYGKAFENWVFHELSAFVSYREFDGMLTHWRLASGIEVDFVLGDMEIAIEAKSSAKITRDHLKGLRSLVEDHPRVARRVVVCREPRARTTDDGIEILPAATFVRRLWRGDLA